VEESTAQSITRLGGSAAFKRGRLRTRFYILESLGFDLQRDVQKKKKTKVGPVRAMPRGSLL